MQILLMGRYTSADRYCFVSPFPALVAILGYGMMRMYWCCRLSFESGCRSVSLDCRILDCRIFFRILDCRSNGGTESGVEEKTLTRSLCAKTLKIS